MNRRQFVILTAAACAGGAACVGCAPEGGTPSGNDAAFVTPGVVDAGPVAGYAAEGVYDRFRDRGFFVVRENGRLFALSAVCTHRRCKLNARPDHTFLCRCHGSTFDPGGKVTKGPASRDLPELPASIDAGQHLIVRVPAAGSSGASS